MQGGASESWKGPARVCVCVREGVRAHLAPRQGWLPNQGCLPTEEPMKDLPWREKKKSLEPSSRGHVSHGCSQPQGTPGMLIAARPTGGVWNHRGRLVIEQGCLWRW